MILPTRIPPEAAKVFSGKIYDIYQWQQELYDGTFTTFEMAKHIDAVSIIPILDDDRVVILHEQQPRHKARIAFPGGHIDRGEGPFEAAVRELQEETGMKFKDIKLVAVDDWGDAKLDWWVFRFVATGFIEEVETKFDPGEIIEREIVDFSRAKELSHGNGYMSLSVMDQVNEVGQLRSMKAIEL